MSIPIHQQHTKRIQARATVITCSDTRTRATDSSGQLIRTMLDEQQHQCMAYHLIPDDPSEIQRIIRTSIPTSDVILMTGGTGISKRDNSFEVVSGMIERTLPGFGELFRYLSYKEIGAAAMLSRAHAGVIGDAILFSMPGSRAAVQLAMTELILPQIGHLVSELRKG